MSLPKITVVTPSFNQGHYLEATFQSVIAQEYPNLEWFVVDGGSKDNSVELIKKYEKHFNWWVSEKDRNHPHAPIGPVTQAAIGTDNGPVIVQQASECVRVVFE